MLCTPPPTLFFYNILYCSLMTYFFLLWCILGKKTLDQFFKLNLYEFVLSLNIPGAIHPILQIELVHAKQQAQQEFKNIQYVPQTAVTLSVFASVCILLLWLQYVFESLLSHILYAALYVRIWKIVPIVIWVDIVIRIPA